MQILKASLRARLTSIEWKLSRKEFQVQIPVDSSANAGIVCDENGFGNEITLRFHVSLVGFRLRQFHLSRICLSHANSEFHFRRWVFSALRPFIRAGNVIYLWKMRNNKAARCFTSSSLQRRSVLFSLSRPKAWNNMLKFSRRRKRVSFILIIILWGAFWKSTRRWRGNPSNNFSTSSSCVRTLGSFWLLLLQRKHQATGGSSKRAN